MHVGMTFPARIPFLKRALGPNHQGGQIDRGGEVSGASLRREQKHGMLHQGGEIERAGCIDGQDPFGSHADGDFVGFLLLGRCGDEADEVIGRAKNPGGKGDEILFAKLEVHGAAEIDEEKLTPGDLREFIENRQGKFLGGVGNVQAEVDGVFGRLDQTEGIEQAQEGIDLVLLVGMRRQGDRVGVVGGKTVGSAFETDPDRCIGEPDKHGEAPVKATFGGDDPVEVLHGRGIFQHRLPRVPARFEQDDFVDRGAGLRDGRTRRIARDGDVRLGVMAAQGVQERECINHISHAIAANDQNAGTAGIAAGQIDPVELKGAGKQIENGAGDFHERCVDTRLVNGASVAICL
jgi:hypothetical protein